MNFRLSSIFKFFISRRFEIIINSNENWISQTQNCSIKILLTSGKIWVNQSKKIHPTWKTNGIKSERSMILFINSQSLTSAQIQLRSPDIIPFIAVSYHHLISAISLSKKLTMVYFVVLLQGNAMLDNGWHLLKWPERKERNVFKYLHLFIKTIDRPGWGERGIISYYYEKCQVLRQYGYCYYSLHWPSLPEYYRCSTHHGY